MLFTNSRKMLLQKIVFGGLVLDLSQKKPKQQVSAFEVSTEK